MNSQLFYVDPRLTNEGRFPAVPGSIVNYQYKLPFLANVFPVRSIRIFTPSDLTNTPAISSTPGLLTLRKADGTYLLDAVPLGLFFVNFGLPPQRKKILFGPDFFPDPRLSFIQWTVGGITGLQAIEFIYS
jgi:hypothetical protein